MEPRQRTGAAAVNCKNCGNPIVWVPDHGGRWTHYRADFTCGKPESSPEDPRWRTTLDDSGGDLG